MSERDEIKTLCPGCGFDVEVNSHGDCDTCNAQAIGAGVDLAHAWRADCSEAEKGVSEAHRLMYATKINGFRDGIFVGVCMGILAGLVLAVVFWPRTAEARWSHGAAERITADREAIEQAAWAYGVPATLLASLGAHETHARPIQQIAGGNCWGVCQIYWPSWAKLLRLEGIAESPLDLLDERTGWLAGAAVLARLRADYPELSLPLLLCRYGCKPEVSRQLKWGCDYSRAVLANLPAAVWALWQTNTEAAGAAGE